MTTVDKLREVITLLELYQKADDEAVRFLKGFTAKRDDIDHNSRARKAIAILAKVIEEMEPQPTWEVNTGQEKHPWKSSPPYNGDGL